MYKVLFAGSVPWTQGSFDWKIGDELNADHLEGMG